MLGIAEGTHHGKHSMWNFTMGTHQAKHSMWDMVVGTGFFTFIPQHSTS